MTATLTIPSLGSASEVVKNRPKAAEKASNYFGFMP
jgi:hypothetical protein